MSALSSVSQERGPVDPHVEFLQLYPVVVRHARVVFRGRAPAEREEAVAEAVAAAFESYVGLKARGKDPLHDFPSALATFAALHVKDCRHVGGTCNRRDVLSRKTQQRRGFRVESLAASNRTSHEARCCAVRGPRRATVFEEHLCDNTRTPVPDQVAFRLDFSAFLQTLTERDRRMALTLGDGHPAHEVAGRFRVSAARVTQLRQQWCRAWRVCQGETPERENAPGPFAAAL